jgi:hypothetical protein
MWWPIASTNASRSTTATRKITFGRLRSADDPKR